MLTVFRNMLLFWFLLSTASLARPFNPFNPLTSSSSAPWSLLLRKVKATNLDRGWLSRLGWGLGEAEVSIVDHNPPVTHVARVAFFGSAIPSDGLLGYIIPLSSFTEPCPPISTYPYPSEVFTSANNTGCPTLCLKNHQQHPSEDTIWFALVQRGDCDFVSKAREAQKFGAKAIIVGSNDEALLSMSSRDESSDITISATYITRSAYLNITAMVDASATEVNGIKTVSGLLIGEPPWEWYTPILSFMIVLTLPSLLTLCTLVVHRTRAARAARAERAPEDIVRRLPCRVWNGTGWEKESTVASNAEETTPLLIPRPAQEPEVPNYGAVVVGSSKSAANSMIEEEESNVETLTPIAKPANTLDSPQPIPTPPSPGSTIRNHPPWFASQTECAICLSNFEVGDRVRILPCGHVFHLSEVDEWLIRQRKVCPICKLDVTASLEESDDGDANGNDRPNLFWRIWERIFNGVERLTEPRLPG